MLRYLGLAAAISIFAAPSAWADNSCGAEPIAPAISSAAEMGQKPPVEAQKVKHQAFEDIKAWQAALKDYRDCLDSDSNSTKRDIQNAQSQSKPDQDKIKRLQGELDANAHAYDHSTDSEERVVNDFHALSVAYCSRSDTDKTSCPKT